MRVVWGLGLCLLSLVAQAALPAWQEPRQLDHSRLGQVLDTATGDWLSPAQLVQRLADEAYVLIGEKHDNADHHALQLWLLQQLQQQRPQGALVLEMLTPEQQAAVDRLQAQLLPASEALKTALDWQSGWDWSLYEPLLRWGLQQPERLLAANLAATELREFYRQPLALAEVYSSAAREQLTGLMRTSHCNQLPETQLPGMLSIQQARDQRMVEVLLQAPRPAVLLAGNVHVRKDLGLPLHWPQEQPTAVVVSLQEAADEVPDAEQSDYVWLTPATMTVDYCAALQ